MNFKLFFLLSSLICQFILINTSVLAQKQMPAHYTAAFNLALSRRTEADSKLINNMELVCDWIIDFRLRKGHFPEPGVEQENSISILQNHILKPNPYTFSGLDNEQKKTCSIKFVTELGLNSNMREKLENEIVNSWKEEPGTITVITNTENYLSVWGAGAERTPVRDAKTTKIKIAYREI